MARAKARFCPAFKTLLTDAPDQRDMVNGLGYPRRPHNAAVFFS
jgi:hypothetical protein